MGERVHPHKSHNPTVLLCHLVFPVKYRRAVEEQVDLVLREVELEIEKHYQVKFIESSPPETALRSGDCDIRAVTSIDYRTVMSDNDGMTGKELIKQLKKLAKTRQIEVRQERKRGKGSHITLYFGDRYAVMPDLKKELKTGTLSAILNQLNVDKQDLGTDILTQRP